MQLKAALPILGLLYSISLPALSVEPSANPLEQSQVDALKDSLSEALEYFVFGPMPEQCVLVNPATFAIPKPLHTPELVLLMGQLSGVWRDERGIFYYIYFTPSMQFIFEDHQAEWSTHYWPWTRVDKIVSLMEQEDRHTTEPSINNERQKLNIAMYRLAMQVPTPKSEHELQNTGIIMRILANNLPYFLKVDSFNEQESSINGHIAGTILDVDAAFSIQMVDSPDHQVRIKLNDVFITQERKLTKSEEMHILKISDYLMPRQIFGPNTG